MIRPLEPLLAANVLTLCCAKCTRVRRFGVSNGADAVKETSAAIARLGWIQRDGVTVCPSCPQTREERARRGEPVAVAHA